MLILVAIVTKFKIKRNFFAEFQQPARFSNKSNKRLPRYCIFIFSLSFRVASLKSFLCENKAENLQTGDFHLAQIPDFGMRYFENYLSH